MATLYTLDQIRQVVRTMDFSEDIEKGFIAYSNGEVVVPPVGELIFEDPPGDTHIKYGYIKGDDSYVIKIASGFYENVKINLPSGSGLMLVFSQKTGELKTILLDEGYLTNVRTAVAGEIVARYMAPDSVSAIGVFGTGTMARMQVEILKSVTDCKRVIVWGRSETSLKAYKDDMESVGYDVQTTLDSIEVTASCNLIIMTTPATSPLIDVMQIMPGTHFTAIGSDTALKQELDTRIFDLADIVVADSLSQCRERGDIYKALVAGDLKIEKVKELGAAIKTGQRIRQSVEQVTVADLTGVAVQDVQVAKAVSRALDAVSGIQ
ncbi:ornithine cyclodeaminase family protein [Chromatiales bacterium (ex Bugula neritina AB1)]|nr:ornithine cyclodeaminase family protein [Chromatiales bacterium (ex Bugula neritina AB1)]